MPDLRIDTEDFNDPWNVHSNTKGKGRASRHSDSILDSGANFNQAQDMDINKMQENGEHISYDHTSGFGADDDYGGSYPPLSAQQPTSNSHSRHSSVAPIIHHQGSQQPFPQSSALEGTTLDVLSGQHSVYPQFTLSQSASLQPPPTSRQGSVLPYLPTSRQGSVQPHLAPSRQGSVQPQLPCSHQGTAVQSPTQSRQGSVNPLSHTMDRDKPQDETNARVSKKRPYVNVRGSNEPKPKRKAKKVPQTPIQPLRETGILAGPSSGTRSQVRWTNPMIVATDATPVPGARRTRHVTALHLSDNVEDEDT